jgi:hypothetical protein
MEPDVLGPNAKCCTARAAEEQVPPSPGMYAIFVDAARSLAEPYAQTLESRETCLLYIGIATKSLSKRLVAQDLNHRSPSSFFRSLGAVLGYRPPEGSLLKKKNHRNFQFSGDDTDKIREWIKSRLFVSWVCGSDGLTKAEVSAINHWCPLLNIMHNPSRLSSLLQLRHDCCAIALRTAQNPTKSVE